MAGPAPPADPATARRGRLAAGHAGQCRGQMLADHGPFLPVTHGRQPVLSATFGVLWPTTDFVGHRWPTSGPCCSTMPAVDGGPAADGRQAASPPRRSAIIEEGPAARKRER